MKRICLLTVLILFGVFLVGCSSNIAKVSSKDGTVVINKATMDLTDYSGITASKVIDDVCTVDYYLCDTEINCVHNTSNIYYEDFTPYKKAKYYTLYLESEVYMYYPYGKQFIEGHCSIKQNPNTNELMMTATEAIEMLYAQMEHMELGKQVDTVTFNGVVDVNVSNVEYHVRPNEIVIPGLVRVTSVGTQATNTQMSSIGEFPIAKASTDKYDYYYYNGIYIQATLGMNLDDIIILH